MILYLPPDRRFTSPNLKLIHVIVFHFHNFAPAIYCAPFTRREPPASQTTNISTNSNPAYPRKSNRTLKISDSAPQTIGIVPILA